MKSVSDPDDPLGTQGDKLIVYSYVDYEGKINRYCPRVYFVFETVAEQVDDFGQEVYYKVRLCGLKNV